MMIARRWCDDDAQVWPRLAPCEPKVSIVQITLKKKKQISLTDFFSLYCLLGKSGNSKDICGDDKHKEDGDPWNVEAQAAFLGPNLWDKTLPYDADLKVHQVSNFPVLFCGLFSFLSD